MAWEIPEPTPTPSDISTYDARVEERETARRRPETASEAHTSRDAEHVKILRRWTGIHMKEVGRRSRYVRYELLRFLQEHYRSEGDEERDPVAALLSTCTGVARDAALYSLMLSTGPFRNPEGVRDGLAAYLVHVARGHLEMPLEMEDALWLLERYRCKAPLSQVIIGRLDRAVVDITEVLDLAAAVDEMPGPADPSVRYHLRRAVQLAVEQGRDEFRQTLDARERKAINDRWTTGIQFSALMKLFPPRELPTLVAAHPREYVDAVRAALEMGSNAGSNTLDGMVDRLLSGLDAPFVLRPDQLAFTERLLDNPASIRAFERWHAAAERRDPKTAWSRLCADLAGERGVLSSIADDNAVKSALVARILALQLDSDGLVAVTAVIRNRIVEGRLADEGFDAEYKKALDENATLLLEPGERDPALKELLVLDVDKEKRDADFDGFFDKGFY